jgi:hypothetical protein
MVTRLNQTEEANVQSLHIVKLFSAFHSACNPVNIIASFCDAGITLHLDKDALPVCHIDIEQCRCLLHQLDVPSTSTQRTGAEPPGEVSESDERNVPLWLQMLDVEAALLLEQNDGWPQ